MSTNKTISEFPLTSLSSTDIFLINHLNTTSTVTFHTLSSTISQNISTNVVNNLTGDNIVQKLSTIFIKKPTTATNGQILTYNGSNWVASNVPAFNGFGSGYFTGTFLSAGENKTFTVPSGLKKIEIIAVGSGGNGSLYPAGSYVENLNTIGTINFFGNTLCVPYRNSTYSSVEPYVDIASGIGGGNGSKGASKGSSLRGAGGGSGGWTKKTLYVNTGDVFTYTTGIPYRESRISKTSWFMTANAGGDATNFTNVGGSGRAGTGGTIGGDFDIGYEGESGQGGGPGGSNLGGRQRGLDGNFGSIFGGYIFVRIIP